jgi:hypothetical protein
MVISVVILAALVVEVCLLIEALRPRIVHRWWQATIDTLRARPLIAVVALTSVPVAGAIIGSSAGDEAVTGFAPDAGALRIAVMIAVAATVGGTGAYRIAMRRRDRRDG